MHRFSLCLMDYGDGCKTSITKLHESIAVVQSMRKPDCEDITSDSVELCETADCFLHIQHIGTKIRLPTRSKKSS